MPIIEKISNALQLRNSDASKWSKIVGAKFCTEIPSVLKKNGVIVLNGTKTAVRGATDANYFLVFSSTILKERNDELVKRTTTILVPADTDGITIEPIEDHFQEIGKAQFSRVHFDDVEISPENIIGIDLNFNSFLNFNSRNMAKIREIRFNSLIFSKTRNLQICERSDFLTYWTNICVRRAKF